MGLLYTLMGYIYYIVSLLYGLFVMGPLAQKPPKQVQIYGWKLTENIYYWN